MSALPIIAVVGTLGTLLAMASGKSASAAPKANGKKRPAEVEPIEPLELVEPVSPAPISTGNQRVTIDPIVTRSPGIVGDIDRGGTRGQPVTPEPHDEFIGRVKDELQDIGEKIEDIREGRVTIDEIVTSGQEVLDELEPLEPVEPIEKTVPPSPPTKVSKREALAVEVYNMLSDGAPVKDTALLKAYQTQEGLQPSNFYGVGTGKSLIKYGFVPPIPFSWSPDAKRRTDQKNDWRGNMLTMARRDPQRADEWEAAAQV